MAFERIYTVWDYYDGPRSGIAVYLGQPHHYSCEWNKVADDYAEWFLLTPIDGEALALALEQWKIWREWERKFHRGEVLQSTHPALPGQHPRYEELGVTLKAHIATLSGTRIRARARFRAQSGQEKIVPGVMRELEVEWSDAETIAAP